MKKKVEKITKDKKMEIKITDRKKVVEALQ